MKNTETIIAAARRVVEAENALKTALAQLHAAVEGIDYVVTVAAKIPLEVSPATPPPSAPKPVPAAPHVEVPVRRKATPIEQPAPAAKGGFREGSRPAKIVATLQKRGAPMKLAEISKAMRDPETTSIAAALNSLCKKGLTKRVGYGTYCIAGVEASPDAAPEKATAPAQTAPPAAPAPARDTMAEEAAMDLGREAFRSKGKKDKAADLNPYDDATPALQHAWFLGWNEAANG